MAKWERIGAMPVEPVTMRLDRPIPAWQFQAWELIAPRLPLWTRVLMGRVFGRLRLGSRARRWCLLRMSVIAWDATARSRYDLLLPVLDPACEWRFDANLVTLGFEECYRGHEGIRQGIENWNQYWTEIEFSLLEVVDAGDTLLQRLTLAGRGAHSDVPTEMEMSNVIRLTPLIADLHNFLDDAAALREAGFSPVVRDSGSAQR